MYEAIKTVKLIATFLENVFIYSPFLYCMSSNHKSQSALEYMMTYGWAILVIVIVAGVLYSLGIFSPASSLSSTVTGFSNLGSVTGECTANGILRISLGDSTGYPINITSVTAKSSTGQISTFQPNSTVDPSPIIQSTSNYIFSVSNTCPAAGSRYSLAVTVNYTEPGQIFPGPYTSTGTVAGTVNYNSLPSFIPDFNGDGLINVSTTAFENNSFTVVAWVSLAVANAGHYQDFFTSGLGCTTDQSFEYGTNINTINTNDYMAFCNDDIYNFSNVFNVSGWYFVVAEWNKSTKVQGIYVYNSNGQLVSSEARTSTGYLDTYKSFACIGGGNTGCWTPNVGLEGYLSDAQIYLSALSLSQLNSLDSEGFNDIPLKGVGLAGYWPLNGTAKDYSGNGNNGVASNVVYTSNYQS